MANIYPFRHLRWGSPRPLSTPDFLRERPRRRWLRRGGKWLRNYFGFVLLGAMLGLAAITLEPWRDERASAPAAGHVTATDGDSLRVGNQRIRLIGIDAPELTQTCRDARGGPWDCGRAAKARLAELVASDNVSCSARDTDRYGRTLASCSAGRIDLGEAMVRDGLALATDDRYWHAQIAARSARRRLWQGEFETPQEWRKRYPRADRQDRRSE
jgi:endonuclease YncB( thermonuclease family)